MPYKDKTKQQEYQKNWDVTRKRKRQQFVIEAKSNPCQACGCLFPTQCMEFHHKDPSTKLDSINALLKKKASEQILKEEIGKCYLLCANCHRKVHADLISIIPL